MAERYIVPTVRAESLDADFHRCAIEPAPVPGQPAFDLSVQKKNVVFRRRVRLESRTSLTHVRNRQDREIVLVDANPARFSLDDRDAELPEQTKDAASLARSRRVVIAGDDHDFRVRQRPLETLELHERRKNRGIRRPHCVENIASHQHQLRAQLDYPINDRFEGLSDINLSLIDAGLGLSLVLSESEMDVC